MSQTILRRKFVKQSAVLTAAAMIPWSCMPASARTYKIGLQLFSVRDFMEKDPIDTLKKVKAMGYEDF